MRNQIEMSYRIGIRTFYINSQQTEDENNITLEVLKNDKCDVLIVSPEQLANKSRIDKILSHIKLGIGLFVVDEAHCISDWGHDFRPDYRRIVGIVNMLPPNIPLLTTTATANNRVVDDIINQLGQNIHISANH